MFKPAEPTIDRLERFYALVNDLHEDTAAKPARATDTGGEAEEPQGLRPQSLAEVAEEIQGGAAEAVVLDPAALCEALFRRRRTREMARIVLVHADGRDLSEEEAGSVTPAALRSAIPFYLIGLAELLTVFGGSASEEGYAMVTGARPPSAPATASTTFSGTSASA